MKCVSLVKALDIHAAEVFACVGAGGKTTTCWRLWTECRELGQASIFTTTTHILEPILPPGTALLLSPDPDPVHIRQVLAKVTGLVVAARRLIEAPVEFEPNPIAPARPFKLAGLPPEHIDRLSEELARVTWLIEADGARGRSLKAPAAHEPAVPTSASIVAALAHLDAIGRPLDESIAHRPERLAEYFQMRLGDRITAEHIVHLLADPAAGLKGIPAGARAVAVLSQSDEAQIHPHAKPIAEKLLASGRYERVVAGSLRAAHPVLEVFAA